MKVVLAEKPSVARELAAFLGAGLKCDGFYEGSGYQVTWSFGHLVSLKDPEDYDPALKTWSLQTLPFVPDRFELKLVDDKDSRKQFVVIKRLLRAGDELICATDAGREGELIFRYILQMSGCERVRFRRLWLRSLTKDAIRDAFDHLHPGSDYDALFAAAKCRSESDWIVGLNATRNYTVRYGDNGLLWSVGRVQTPVLAMIVWRDEQIHHFKPQPFWELLTCYRKVTFAYKGDRFEREDDAQVLLDQVRDKPFVVQKVQNRKERILPPLLYDLTELQRDMNRRFGTSAAATLKATQSLYEQKLLTYPRTDSRFLSRDMKGEVPKILRKLKAIKEAEIDRLDLDTLAFTSRIINDNKVADHHAIIATGKTPGKLPPHLHKVFDAVLTRLIAAFYPPCVKEVTTVDGASNKVPFRATGVRVLEPGWTVLYPKGSKNGNWREGEQEQQQQELPVFVAGESGPHEPIIKSGQTKPLPHYTENSLLGAMETAGKLVDDEQLKEALKEKGLGTSATRAAIIETLLKRGYIVRSNKKLTATDLGRYLVALVHDPNLKSPELTGEWEAKLKAIERGQLDPLHFMGEIVQFISNLVRASDASGVDPNQLGPCPRCGRPVIEGHRDFGCSDWRQGCNFVLRKQYQGVRLELPQVRELIQQRFLRKPVTLSG